MPERSSSVPTVVTTEPSSRSTATPWCGVRSVRVVTSGLSVAPSRSASESKDRIEPSPSP